MRRKISRFAYGQNGASYLTFIGGISGNLITFTNSNYNDPASWGDEQTLALGSDHNFFQTPSIRAARKDMAEDNVIVVASDYITAKGLVYRRTNVGAFSQYSTISVPSSYIFSFSSFVRKTAGESNIAIGFAEGFGPFSGQYILYDGTELSDIYKISGNIDIGSTPQIAILSDGSRVASFTGSGGAKLYFARNSDSMAVDDTVLSQVSVYPNPVADVLNIKTDKPLQSVEIYGMSGQKVLSATKFVNAQLNVSSLAPGVYVLKMKTEGEPIKTLKVIKK